MMKPSATEKLLAAALFTLTVFHTTSHFRIQHQVGSLTQTAPCSADTQSLGKQLQVYGEIVQIDISPSFLPESESQDPPGEVLIALNTDVNCRINAVVANQEWQSWSHAQQELLTIGASVEIGGQVGSSDGRVVLEVTQPPNLH